mmetsp:Transcript_10168/g.14956  ORF Transcript_10168/g.14956 Transcript_10168/m.14956 type:complete len:109 (+) Transcript_10168:3534-3860(+)
MPQLLHVFTCASPPFVYLSCCLKGDGAINSKIEIKYCIGMLDYIVARLSSKTHVSRSAQSRLFGDVKDGTPIGSFLNLNCGHNNQYSAEEREKLTSLMNRACSDAHAV